MKKNQDIKSYSGGVYIKTYCNINGVWRTVNSIKTIVGDIIKTVTEPKVNINGVWKDEEKTYKVRVYDGSSLLKEFSVKQGGAISLSNVGYSGMDGYSTSSDNPYPVYNKNSTISNINNDLNLYAVYRNETYGAISSTRSNVTVTASQYRSNVLFTTDQGFGVLQSGDGVHPPYAMVNGSAVYYYVTLNKGDVVKICGGGNSNYTTYTSEFYYYTDGYHF